MRTFCGIPGEPRGGARHRILPKIYRARGVPFAVGAVFMV